MAFFSKQWGGWGAEGEKKAIKYNRRLLKGRIWDEMSSSRAATALLRELLIKPRQTGMYLFRHDSSRKALVSYIVYSIENFFHLFIK